MLTLNFVTNIFILAATVYLLILVVSVLARIKKEQGYWAFSAVGYQFAGIIFCLLSIGLPYLRFGTLNTANNGMLFFAGVAVTYIPNLIVWWRKRSAGAA